MDKVDQQAANARTGWKRRRPTTESLGDTHMRFKNLTDNTNLEQGAARHHRHYHPTDKKQENREERGRQVTAQNNAVEATNTESPSRTEGVK